MSENHGASRSEEASSNAPDDAGSERSSLTEGETSSSSSTTDQDAPPQRRSSAFPGILTRFISAADWGRSAAAAGIVYVVMLLTTVLLGGVLLLGLVGGSLSDTTSSSSLGGALGGARETLSNSSAGFFFTAALLFQMVSMALGSPLRVVVRGEGLYGGLDEMTMLVLHGTPLMITAAGIFTLYLVSKILTRRTLAAGEHLSPAKLWVLSGLTAGIFTLFTLVVSAVFMARASSDELIGEDMRLIVHAVGWQSVVFPLIIGTLISRWGRQGAVSARPSTVRDAMNRFAPGLAVGARLLLVGVLVLMALLSVISGIHALVVEGFTAGIVILLCGPVLAVDLISLGMFSGITLRMSTPYSGQLFGTSDNTEVQRWFLGDLMEPQTAVIAVLVVILWVLMVLWLAFAWSGRRPRLNSPFSWVIMPVLFCVTGLLMLWAGHLGGSLKLPAFAGSLGPAGWTPLIMLVWGTAVELLARFMVPAVAGALPESARGVLLGQSEQQVWTEDAENDAVSSDAADHERGPSEGETADREP